MSSPLVIMCLSKSITPLTHMLGVVGNEAVINVEDVRTPLGVRKVPVLSGNAIRHRCVRAPAAQYLVEQWELGGKLSRDQLNLLFHGGLRRDKGGRQSLREIADMQRLFPLLELLGGCLPSGIVSGTLRADRAMLVCRENADRIRSVAQGLEIDQHLAPAGSFVSRWQYVRGMISQSAPHLVDKSSTAEDSMMPFSGTCVVPGAHWFHRFVIDRPTPITVGCLLYALTCWQRDGGTIGGQSSRGHGVLETSIVGDIDQSAMTEYRNYIKGVKDDAMKLLVDLFGEAKKQKSLLEDDSE